MHSQQTKHYENEVKDSPQTFATEVHSLDKNTMRSNQSLERIN